VSLTLRGLLFGMGAGWGLLAALFLFDLFVVERGWCGHLSGGGLLCPGQPGRVHQDCSLGARAVQQLHGCLRSARSVPSCAAVHGAGRGHGPLIAAQECTNCGRCIDVCAEQVFEITVGFAVKAEKTSENT
jgi:ferredoxin-type protein NapH